MSRSHSQVILGRVVRKLVNVNPGLNQPRSQGLFPILSAGREKALASAGHVHT